MDHLRRKLAHFAPLSDPDERRLMEIGRNTEQVPAERDIVRQGERPRSVFVLTSGMACRYRILQNGRRQILTFLIPGDICDLHVFLLKEMDHSIGTLSPVVLSAIETRDVVDMIFKHPRITAALWWSMLQEEAILRERIVALGSRDAEGKLAYLVCELLWRFQAVGEADDQSFELPLTQEELGDALGLTTSYVNRLLKRLRERQLISMHDRTLRVDDIQKLSDLADFDASYLHLGGAPNEIQDLFKEMEAD